MHDTRCINCLGLFTTRRRVVETLSVFLAFVFPSAFTWCVVSRVGNPEEELTSRLSHVMFGCSRLMVGKDCCPSSPFPAYAQCIKGV